MTGDTDKTMPVDATAQALATFQQEIASFGKDIGHLGEDVGRLDKQVTALVSDVTTLKISVQAWGKAATMIGLPSAISILVLLGCFWGAWKKVNNLETRVQTLNTQVTTLNTYSADIARQRDAALAVVDAQAAKSVKTALAAQIKDMSEQESISTKFFLAAAPGKCPSWAPKISTVFVMVSPPPSGWPTDGAGPVYANTHISSNDICGRP
jgi:outer membrane murein-binding lipoprotein Lpp